MSCIGTSTIGAVTTGGGESVLHLFDDGAVALLCGLCRGSEQSAHLGPGDTCRTCGNYCVEDLALAASACQHGTLPLGRGALSQEWETTSYRIESDEPILAGLDGEALRFESPLNLEIHPRGLSVPVPAGTRSGYVPPGEVVAARLLDLAETAGLAE